MFGGVCLCLLIPFARTTRRLFKKSKTKINFSSKANAKQLVIMKNASENVTLEILKGRQHLNAQQAVCSHSNAPPPIDPITNPEYLSNHPPTTFSLKHTNLALPPEILSEIFEYLAIDSTPEMFSMDILSCSLVCRGWNYTAAPIVRNCFGINGFHPKTLYEIRQIRAILTDVNFVRLGYLALIPKVVASWEYIVHGENLEAFIDIFQVIGTVWHPRCMFSLRLPIIRSSGIDILRILRFVCSIDRDWRLRLTRLSLSVCRIGEKAFGTNAIISLLGTLVNLEEIHLLDRSYLSAAVFHTLSKCTRLNTVIIGRPYYIDSRALYFAIRAWPLLREFAIQLERTCIRLAPIVTQLTQSCPALTRLALEGRWWGDLHLGTDDGGSLRLRRALSSLVRARGAELTHLSLRSLPCVDDGLLALLVAEAPAIKELHLTDLKKLKALVAPGAWAGLRSLRILHCDQVYREWVRKTMEGCRLPLVLKTDRYFVSLEIEEGMVKKDGVEIVR